jgi:surfeit locus 1 family protein
MVTRSFDSSILRRPRWIVAIVVGIMISLLFIRLGIWQLDRLDERRAQNTTIEGRMAEPPRPLVGILGQYGGDADAMAYRHAVAEGEFRTDDEFFSIGRTYGDLSGTLVATPFDLEDGSVLIVVRGLVPPGTPGPPAPGYEPAAGVMRIEGPLQPGEESTAIGESPPDAGDLTSLSRLDLEYIDRWVSGDVLPVLLFLEGWTVLNPENIPEPIPRPELTEGSHLGYAVQWFAFALIVFFGVAALVYKEGTAPSATESEPDRTSLM